MKKEGNSARSNSSSNYRSSNNNCSRNNRSERNNKTRRENTGCCRGRKVCSKYCRRAYRNTGERRKII